MPQNWKLRDFIKKIRNCKTAAEERSLVSKECALIRAAIRNEDKTYLVRNVSKLLYIHLIGYPAHFGQLAVLRLIASSKLLEKKIGYLGATMLLEEDSEVQLLITNSLKKDLMSECQFIVSLALCTLGNICSSEMARDLSPEIETLLKSPSISIRKKAVLCCCRFIRKVPTLAHVFFPIVCSLLNDHHHGILLTAVILLTELCTNNNEALISTRELVPHLVQILKTLVFEFNPEHNFGGISDPFLQIKILKLLGILGQNDSITSDLISDVLAQIASNTDTLLNSGNAILYEAVRTIMKVQVNTGLRVLAVNILGRFLSSTDKNIRYIALNCLLKAIHGKIDAVQRHCSVIVECLKDCDPSIRRRALEVLFGLMNKSNIKQITEEILIFLQVAESDLRPYICVTLAMMCKQYSSDSRWHVDTILSCLKIGQNNFSNESVVEIIQTFLSLTELRLYIVHRLFNSLRMCDVELPLILVSVWFIGEFAELLVQNQTFSFEEINFEKISESEVVECFSKTILSPFSSNLVKEMSLTSLIKIAARFPKEIETIRTVLKCFETDFNVEVQQRAVEYLGLLDHREILKSVLEPMPIKELKHQLDKFYLTEEVEAKKEQNTPSTEIVDLLEIFDDTSLDCQLKKTNYLKKLMNFQNELDRNEHIGQSIYNKNGIEVVVYLESSDSQNSNLFTAYISNSNSFPIYDFSLQMAVPKSMKLKMHPTTEKTILPNNSRKIVQRFEIEAKKIDEIKLRLKTIYQFENKKFEDISVIPSLRSFQ